MCGPHANTACIAVLQRVRVRSAQLVIASVPSDVQLASHVGHDVAAETMAARAVRVCVSVGCSNPARCEMSCARTDHEATHSSGSAADGHDPLASYVGGSLVIGMAELLDRKGVVVYRPPFGLPSLELALLSRMHRIRVSGGGPPAGVGFVAESLALARAVDTMSEAEQDRLAGRACAVAVCIHAHKTQQAKVPVHGEQVASTDPIVLYGKRMHPPLRHGSGASVYGSVEPNANVFLAESDALVAATQPVVAPGEEILLRIHPSTAFPGGSWVLQKIAGEASQGGGVRYGFVATIEVVLAWYCARP
jgi:hypothetical protein